MSGQPGSRMKQLRGHEAAGRPGERRDHLLDHVIRMRRHRGLLHVAVKLFGKQRCLMAARLQRELHEPAACSMLSQGPDVTSRRREVIQTGKGSETE